MCGLNGLLIFANFAAVLTARCNPLWSTVAVPAVDSTHWALSAVSRYDSPLSLIRWMLDCAHAPLFPLISCQEKSILRPLSPDSWLVQTGFFVVQSICSYRFDDGFDLIVCLKSQIARYVG